MNVANELSRRGHQVEIRCLPFTLDSKRKIRPNLSPKVSYREGYFHTIRDSDLNYITYSPLNWLNFRVKKGKKIAGLHSWCYYYPISKRFGLLPNVASLVHKFVGNMELNKFDAVHSLTNFFPIDHPNVYVIHNFSDGTVYRPCESKRKVFSVGFASRPIWQKGYDIFLKLKQKLDDILFISAGDIPESEMPKFYSRNHLTLAPTRPINFPPRLMVDSMTVIESNLCGTPVLCYGDNPYDPIDLPITFAKFIPDFADKIMYLRDNYDSYQKLSVECRSSALKTFEKLVVVDQIERMFEEVSGNV